MSEKIIERWGKEIIKNSIKRDKMGFPEYEEIATYKLVKVVRYNKPHNEMNTLYNGE